MIYQRNLYLGVNRRGSLSVSQMRQTLRGTSKRRKNRKVSLPVFS